MPVYKSDNGTWYVLTRYLDWKGERKQTCKRGFETRKEAVEWERTFQQQNAADMDMTFEAFFELYANDIKPRLKENTWLTKEHIVETKIMPYFAKRIISEITTKDVMAWQNELLAYRDENRKPYSQTYLKTVHNQLSAIFNHAVRHYDLRSNPASKAGNMGTEERKEMKFWTKDEYKKFADEMMDKPVSYYAFEVLYWCGIREGELLALTPADFDFVKGTLTINKSYQRLKGRDVITTPKTKKSNRTIKMPQFLCEEMQDYLGMLYGVGKKDRIFNISKHYLSREMERGSKAAGVKRIRIHDLRHPYVKHTTKKYNSEKQKTQATKMNLILLPMRCFVFSGGRYASLKEFPGNGCRSNSGCGKLENELYHSSGFRVRFHSAIGAFAIPVRANFALVFAALHFGVLGAFGLDGHIPAVILADQILESYIHRRFFRIRFGCPGFAQ